MNTLKNILLVALLCATSGCATSGMSKVVARSYLPPTSQELEDWDSERSSRVIKGLMEWERVELARMGVERKLHSQAGALPSVDTSEDDKWINIALGWLLKSGF